MSFIASLTQAENHINAAKNCLIIVENSADRVHLNRANDHQNNTSAIENSADQAHLNRANDHQTELEAQRAQLLAEIDQVPYLERTGIQEQINAINQQLNPSTTPTQSAIDTDNDRFVSVEGDESNIHGHDSSTDDESDALYYYHGEDEDGYSVSGGGFTSYQNDDEDAWFQNFELITAHAEWYDTDDEADVQFEAQGWSSEQNIGGHSIELNVWKAEGNLTSTDEKIGGMASATLAGVKYSNGAPSAENDNDIGVTAGLSFSAFGGFNLIHDDPDGDGITNKGFEFSGFGVDVGLTAEDPFRPVEETRDGAEAFGEAVVGFGEAAVESAYNEDSVGDFFGGLIDVKNFGLGK